MPTAAAVTYRNPNVYIDLSAFRIGDLTEYPEAEVEKQVTVKLRFLWEYIEDPDKLLFASDHPFRQL